ncbi:citramalate synthase [Aciditerrimonas ferrireducens]|jgi:2-isopropylmalate synthase|uniref:citramalate synthase n=1 Tax=Aciditerrimonas ferrireducens TaxID=667306 RepID=UPI002004757A|nr:citramalate synthase [Aciditerrimonas ferrireducens]MCK4176849.1 citramalate synthase [Aciditerrimonas ferrireducens]
MSSRPETPRSAHRHAPGAHPVLPGLPEAVEVFDTTLRDGSQQEGLSLSVDDKLRVAEQLDHLGVSYIEGGWPGANPKDEEFFARAQKELRLSHATLVAFGSTRRAGVRAEEDEVLRHLVAAGTEAVCIVAKASLLHVTEALRTTPEEALAMVESSVAFLRRQGLRVFLDAEHFFDGYRQDPAFSRQVLEVAAQAGAETLVLCDTNGGSLPHEVEQAVAEVVAEFDRRIGVHCHNDTGCAVANSLAAVRAGATHVQGCVNGYGERAGNADLAVAIPNLSLKLGIRTIPAERLERLTPVAHHIAEIVNVPPNPQQPYVGHAAFAHKAGLHTSAIARRRDAYEHISPDAVGNGTRFVVSELAGRSTVALKAAELGLDLSSEEVGRALELLKDLEHQGYHFEVADASLELLLRQVGGWRPRYFELESYRVIADHGGNGHRAAADGRPVLTEATVKLTVGGERRIATAEGNGPVHALDGALRRAIEPFYPALRQVHLTDFRVRVLGGGAGTAAVTRVLVDTADPEATWTTIGVSENIIEASWQALVDAVVYGLLRAGVAPATGPDVLPTGTATPTAETAAAGATAEEVRVP